MSNDFSWVRERHKCTVKMALKNIRDYVERDVQQANELLCATKEAHDSFVIEERDNSVRIRFCVRGYPIDNGQNSNISEVEFREDDDRIVIKSDHHCAKSVFLKWDVDSNTCKLLIDEQMRSADQVSQIALEPLFFKSVY